MLENELALIRESNVKIYFIKKAKRKCIYDAYRFPTAISNEVKSKYCETIEIDVHDKTVGNYDFVHTDKSKVSIVSINDVDTWAQIIESINIADQSHMFLTKENFDDDFLCEVFECERTTQEGQERVYLIARYYKSEPWYKKSRKFAFTADGLVPREEVIIVLNGSIDCVATNSSFFVFSESNFESIFNYYQHASSVITNEEAKIKRWPFLSGIDTMLDKVKAGKTRILKLANALKNSTTDWEHIPLQSVKDVIGRNPDFVSLTLNDQDQIICTEDNVDLIIDIIREVYSKQLFTGDFIETKGV